MGIFLHFKALLKRGLVSLAVRRWLSTRVAEHLIRSWGLTHA